MESAEIRPLQYIDSTTINNIAKAPRENFFRGIKLFGQRDANTVYKEIVALTQNTSITDKDRKKIANHVRHLNKENIEQLAQKLCEYQSKGKNLLQQALIGKECQTIFAHALRSAWRSNNLKEALRTLGVSQENREILKPGKTKQLPETVQDATGRNIPLPKRSQNINYVQAATPFIANALQRAKQEKVSPKEDIKQAAFQLACAWAATPYTTTMSQTIFDVQTNINNPEKNWDDILDDLSKKLAEAQLEDEKTIFRHLQFIVQAMIEIDLLGLTPPPATL